MVAVATLSERPTLASVRAAADMVASRHPVLASALFHEGSAGWWFRPAPAASPVVRQAPPGATWPARFTAALDEPLHPQQSLWRVELVNSAIFTNEPPALVLAAHHSAVDGVSAATLLRELASLSLGHPLGRGDPKPVEAMEDLFAADKEVAAGLSQVPQSVAWRVACSAPVEARRLRCTMRTVSAEVIRTLRARAGGMGTTVTGALMALLVDAGRRFAWTTGTVGFNIPADVRARIDPPLSGDLVGAYFARSHVIAEQAECDVDPWLRANALAASFRRDLAKSLTKEAWTGGELDDLTAEVTRADRATFDLGYLLTNLGVVDAGPAVTGLWFTTVQTAGVEAFVVSCASVCGNLDLTVSWPEPLVTRSDGEALADALLDSISALAS